VHAELFFTNKTAFAKKKKYWGRNKAFIAEDYWHVLATGFNVVCFGFFIFFFWGLKGPGQKKWGKIF